MSDDYLWDKSGELDPEIEQLEGLLGALRYQKSASRRLPITDAQTARRGTARPAYLRPAFAAAALLVTLLAGLWLATHRLAGRSPDAPVVARAADSATVDEPPASSSDGRRQVEKGASTPTPSEIMPERRRDSKKMQVASFGRRAKLVRRVAKSNEAARDLSHIAGTRAPRESKRALSVDIKRQAEQQQAKEQLMLALRLASAKLNIAQRRTHAMPELKTSAEERNRIK